MKVDLNTVATDALLKSQSQVTTSTHSTTSESQDSSYDQTSLSHGGDVVGTLTAQAMSTSATRQDKIAALRQAINSGEYKVDTSQVADAMLSESQQSK